jgi:uncharacterized membrane protein YciS (DUF1049 family)
MMLTFRQMLASFVIGIALLALIIRLVQRGRLDIAYCWLWIGIGIGIMLVVTQYDWVIRLSHLIGAVMPTTTVFLVGFVVILLLCLQFSLVISSHRRQIKRLTQQLALLQQAQSQTRETSFFQEPAIRPPPTPEPPG